MATRHWLTRLTGLLVVSGCILTGCTLSPGLYVNTPSASGNGPRPSTFTAGPVKVIPVSNELVGELEEERLAELSKTHRFPWSSSHEGAAQDDAYEYRVGTNDLLSIAVWGHPELTIVAATEQQGGIPRAVDSLFLNPDSAQPGHRVDQDGNIYFPYVGLVHVEGKTLNEIRTDITERLAAFIPSPQLDIGIAEFRSQRVFVLGAVEDPRSIQITQVPLEIIDAIAEAAGFADEADTRNAILVRGDTRYHIDLQSVMDGNLQQNIVLKSDDVLIIPKNDINSIFMIGEFNANARLTLPSTRLYTLADAITENQVGGFSDEVDPNRFFVFRYVQDSTSSLTEQPLIYYLPLETPNQLLLASRFPLRPRDIIYVAPSRLARWDRLIERILPTVQAIHDPARTIWFRENVASDTTSDRAIDREENE